MHIGWLGLIAGNVDAQPFEPLVRPYSDTENKLMTLMAQKLGHSKPSIYASVGRNTYLVMVDAAPAIAVGLYFVNARKGEVKRLAGGEPGVSDPLPAVRKMRDGTPWVLYIGRVMHRGVGESMYRAIAIKRLANGELEPITSNLADVVWEGHAEICNPKQPWFTTNVTAYQVSDLNGDGFEDIALDASETDCSSGTTRNNKSQFIYHDGQFVRRALTSRSKTDRPQAAGR